MKNTLIITLLAFVSLTAWAVSLDFPKFSAVTIGDIEVTKFDENTETRIRFSGKGLETLFKFLPEVGDAETGVASETIRGFDIFSSSEDSPSQKINFQCEKGVESVDCRITLTKGVIAG